LGSGFSFMRSSVPYDGGADSYAAERSLTVTDDFFGDTADGILWWVELQFSMPVSRLRECAGMSLEGPAVVRGACLRPERLRRSRLRRSTCRDPLQLFGGS
jgi:hypothetical protein